MSISWNFADPEDTAVITLDRIIRGETIVRLVTHDDDDGSWQFLDGDQVFEEDAVIVSLSEIVQFDPTLLELADLPRGDFAWRRDLDQAWCRGTGEPPTNLVD